MKVTINKETGLGRPEHSRENYLPVISQSGEILTEGTWECEKVWQWKHPFDRQIKDWKDEKNIDECTTHEYSVSHGYETREVYRVVLPTHPDVKETMEGYIEQIWRHRSEEYEGSIMMSKSSFFQAIQDINSICKQEVLADIEKYQFESIVDLTDLIKVIKEL